MKHIDLDTAIAHCDFVAVARSHGVVMPEQSAIARRFQRQVAAMIDAALLLSDFARVNRLRRIARRMARAS